MLNSIEIVIKYVSDDTNKVRHLLAFLASLWCPFSDTWRHSQDYVLNLPGLEPMPLA